jgi:hypothetical protein
LQGSPASLRHVAPLGREGGGGDFTEDESDYSDADASPRRGGLEPISDARTKHQHQQRQQQQQQQQQQYHQHGRVAPSPQQQSRNAAPQPVAKPMMRGNLVIVRDDITDTSASEAEESGAESDASARMNLKPLNIRPRPEKKKKAKKERNEGAGVVENQDTLQVTS